MADTAKPIDGPGGGISIRGQIPNVARLSSKAKIMMVTATFIVAGGIVIGTMTAGQGRIRQAEMTAGTSTDGVGTVAAPEAPPPSAPLTTRDMAQTSQPGVDPSDAPDLQQGNTAPTPGQQHREWLEKHKYQRLQGLILASDAALTSEISKGWAGLVNNTNSRSNQFNTGIPGADEDPVVVAQQRYEASRAKLDRMQEAELNRVNAQFAGQSAGLVARQSGAVATGQEQNKAFLDDMKKSFEDGYLPEIKKPSLAETSLFAGSVIPAVMLTGINSDLPGSVTAQVRQTIYDSRNYGVVLIPQGSRLVGQYSADVGYGQKRVLVAWNHLIFPDGSTVNLKGMAGGDGQGRSGFEDQVNNHYVRTFGSAILISLLGVGAQISQPQNSGSFNTPPAGAQAAGALATSMNNTGDKVLNKNLNIQPTLEIRPGYSFNVLVNRTMILPPYMSQ
jgi:type IV secretion system protein VirB10